MYTEMNNFARCRVNERSACRGAMPAVEPRRETSSCNRCDRDDGCGAKGGWGLSGYPLASVYAPIQEWRELYDEERALKAGTLFSELDLPFVCGKSTKGGCGCD